MSVNIPLSEDSVFWLKICIRLKDTLVQKLPKELEWAASSEAKNTKSRYEWRGPGCSGSTSTTTTTTTTTTAAAATTTTGYLLLYVFVYFCNWPEDPSRSGQVPEGLSRKYFRLLLVRDILGDEYICCLPTNGVKAVCTGGTGLY